MNQQDIVHRINHVDGSEIPAQIRFVYHALVGNTHHVHVKTSKCGLKFLIGELWLVKDRPIGWLQRPIVGISTIKAVLDAAPEVYTKLFEKGYDYE